MSGGGIEVPLDPGPPVLSLDFLRSSVRRWTRVNSLAKNSSLVSKVENLTETILFCRVFLIVYSFFQRVVLALELIYIVLHKPRRVCRSCSVQKNVHKRVDAKFNQHFQLFFSVYYLARIERTNLQRDLRRGRSSCMDYVCAGVARSVDGCGAIEMYIVVVGMLE